MTGDGRQQHDDTDRRETPMAILPGVVPRWEWRVFGRRFGGVDGVVSNLEPERVGSSREQYLVSTRSDASVKVRDGVLDVKVRLDVDEHGLELWAPVLKAEFPASAAEVAVAFDALGSTLDASHSSYSLEELAELIDSLEDLAIVEVDKHRRHFRVGECMVESTEIVVDEAATRTVTVESSDAEQVAETLRALGLDDHPNVSVARGLKALVGFGSKRLAVIDVGTNSVKYHLEEYGADTPSCTLADRAVITRLGEDQSDSGVLADVAIDRTVETVVSMVTDARDLGPVDIVAVGTAGLRRAPNSDVLVTAVRDRVAIEVEVITGAEEARLAYLAATSALPSIHGRLDVFDSGGGSTQFTFGYDGSIDEQFSLDVGAVRVAEEFGLAATASSATIDRVLTALAGRLDRLDDRERPDAIVAIGGTATNVAAVKHGLTVYRPDVVHGTVIDVAELDRQIDLYRTRTTDERRSIPGLQKNRAEVILGGICIVRTVLTKLGHDSMTVSDRGLRHGIVIDRLDGGDRRPTA